VGVTLLGDQRLLEQLDHAPVVAHAPLEVRAHEQATSVGEPDHTGHAAYTLSWLAMGHRIRAIITGRVQGVSYRASVAVEARRLHVVGWVRNRSDGAVELEAEGPPAAIAELLAWCEHGPPAARVAQVTVENLVPAGGDSFEIRH
jgi:acylphosphatase